MERFKLKQISSLEKVILLVSNIHQFLGQRYAQRQISFLDRDMQRDKLVDNGNYFIIVVLKYRGKPQIHGHTGC